MIEFYFKINDAKEVRIGEEMHAKDAKLTINIEKNGDMEFKDNNGNTFTLFTKEVDKLCEKFTASKMREIVEEKNQIDFEKTIKNIKAGIKAAAENNHYSREFSKITSEKVREYFRLRGFKVEDINTQQDREFSGVTYNHSTIVSW